jgi:hypothetical protein
MARLTPISLERRHLLEGLIRQRDVDAETVYHRYGVLT